MFDKKAFDEAWINAMVHNDWAKGNAPTIFWFEDRMEILSYVGLPADLSLDQFFGGATDPVNPKLMEIFIQCGFVDKSGHGVPEIVEKYGRQAFKFLGYEIQVTIPFNRMELSDPSNDTIKALGDTLEPSNDTQKPKNDTIDDALDDTFGRNDTIARKNDTLDDPLAEKNDTITGLQKSILEAIGEDGKRTAADLTSLLKVGEATIKRNMKVLVGKGLLVRNGSHRFGNWKIVDGKGKPGEK